MGEKRNVYKLKLGKDLETEKLPRRKKTTQYLSGSFQIIVITIKPYLYTKILCVVTLPLVLTWTKYQPLGKWATLIEERLAVVCISFPRALRMVMVDDFPATPPTLRV